MKEEFMERELLEGLDIKFEIVKAKQNPDWSNIDEFLSLIDEGPVSYDDVFMINRVTDTFSQMDLGHKAMILLELHLQNPEKMSVERVVKELLAEYQALID